ncbi:MAG: pyridoxal-dependent decarboxylase [Candidatus Latescibacterota bacterium]
MTEETLDPEDWRAMRELGHRMVDDMMEWLETARDRPVWSPVPEEVKQALREPLPQEGQGAEAAYKAFRELVLPYPMGSYHPRFWSWVIGTGTPLAMLAEMLAAGMNSNLGGGEHTAGYVEEQVLSWCREMTGFPSSAGGLLVSGSSMGNLVGLAVARNARAEFDVRRRGVGASAQPLAVYASTEAHSSIQKAVELLGLGADGLRLAPVRPDFTVDVDAVRGMIAADRAAGLRPIGIVGTAGTVNTGAVDDLPALADLASREGLWFHVDGAFGALACLSPDLRPRVAGMERADSLTFDFHKWLYLPYEIGVALVRDPEAHRRTFSLTPEYLVHGDRGLNAGVWFSDYGIQLSRGFRALKAWMHIKEHGIEKLGRLVTQNVAQARHLAGLVEREPELELMAPVSLNIVCFRYLAAGRDGAGHDALNQELLIRLQESGVAAPSYTRIHGRYAIRAAITNHRSRQEDFDAMITEVLRLGRELAAGCT